MRDGPHQPRAHKPLLAHTHGILRIRSRLSIPAATGRAQRSIIKSELESTDVSTLPGNDLWPCGYHQLDFQRLAVLPSNVESRHIRTHFTADIQSSFCLSGYPTEISWGHGIIAGVSTCPRNQLRQELPEWRLCDAP